MSPGGVLEPEAGTAGRLTRRGLLLGLPAFLAACQTVPIITTTEGPNTRARAMYGPVLDEPFQIPAVDLSQVDPDFYRTEVLLPMNIEGSAGDIVIDTRARYLYHIQAGGLAIRYGVGVGRDGFSWSGRATIQRKAEWPTWTPPPAMVARDPAARPWANGMPGGLTNPLGARALYLYEGGLDTLYRIHGTPEAWSIGRNVSSGCIRMLNQDVIHLYSRVPIGTRVTVRI